MYCRHVDYHEKWTKKHPKVRCVTNKFIEIQNDLANIKRRIQQKRFYELDQKSAFFLATTQQFIDNLLFSFIIELAKQKGFNSLNRALNDLR